MNIVFFGSGKFAVRSLEALVRQKHHVSLVVTQPDKPKGRHLLCHPTEVKTKAQELKLDIFQPAELNSKPTIDKIKQQNADLFIVISYGHILKKNIFELPKLYSLNVHASLLPKYRGAAPINWAIINGENETGITIIKIDYKMDAGDILFSEKIAIEDIDDAQTLEDKLSKLSANAICKALCLIKEGKAFFTKQSEEEATFAPKLKKNSGLIDWDNGAVCIRNQIRGLIPWPTAFTYYRGSLLKVWKAHLIESAEKDVPGKILEINKNEIKVSCGKGALGISQLQLSGEKRMQVAPFICGHKVTKGDKLG